MPVHDGAQRPPRRPGPLNERLVLDILMIAAAVAWLARLVLG